MAYFEDFSEYTYSGRYWRPNTYNVGWLDHAHQFDTEKPSDEVVSRLWSLCGWSVAQTRGFHTCNLSQCSGQIFSGGVTPARRGNLTLKLGSAEIRLFGVDGKVFAAPNLIYHYVTIHCYRMPEEFVQALYTCDLDSSYFERLTQLGLNWGKTLECNRK